MVAAGVGVGFAAAHQTSTPAPPKPTVINVAVPSSINTTCATDDTQALGAFFYSLALQPKPGPTTVVHFGSDCLQVDGTLFLRGLQNLTITGGKWEETTANDVATGDWSGVGPIRPAYCGNTGYTDDKADLYTLNPFTLMWAWEGGCDITMKNMTIIGPNTAATSGQYKLEQDSLVSFYGTQRALVDNDVIRNPYGDYVTATGMHEVNGTPAAVPDTDITVENCHLSGSGRQGLSVILGERVAFVHNTISSAHATVFDVEEDGVGVAPTDDITIADNTIVGFHYADVLSAQTGAPIDRLAFTGNDLIDGGQMRVIVNDLLPGSDLRFSNNTATAASTGMDFTQPAFSIKGVTNVEVDDNTIPLGKGGLAVLPAGSVLCTGTMCPDPSPVTAPAAPALP